MCDPPNPKGELGLTSVGLGRNPRQTEVKCDMRRIADLYLQ
jgi:hypothetical protein